MYPLSDQSIVQLIVARIATKLELFNVFSCKCLQVLTRKKNHKRYNTSLLFRCFMSLCVEKIITVHKTKVYSRARALYAVPSQVQAHITDKHRLNYLLCIRKEIRLANNTMKAATTLSVRFWLKTIFKTAC